MRHIESEAVQEAIQSVLVLKIQLLENEQDVWRLVKVPAAICLDKLQDQVISPVMGWLRCSKAHVYEDPKDGAVLGTYPTKGHYARSVDAMLARMDFHYVMKDRDIPLGLLLQNEGDTTYFTCDLAEQWVHKITVEEVLPADDCTVQLLDGFGACPPEDGRGVDGRGCLGYAEFLRAYKNNPRKPKIREAIKKMGTAKNITAKPGMPRTRFDPLRFDIGLHRKALEKSIEGPSLRIKGAFGGTKIKLSTRGCGFCGDRLKAISKCSGCRKVSHCSRECQLKGWDEHKRECSKESRKK